MKIIKNRVINYLAWLCKYEIWILLEKLIKKTGLGIEFRHQEGFQMLIWRYIYIYIYLSKYKINRQIKNVINRSRDSMAWTFCSLTAAMLCISFRRCVRAFRASFDGETVDRSLARSMFCVSRSWMSRPQWLQFLQKWGASRAEENLINPENPWYGSQDRLVWFCKFF